MAVTVRYSSVSRKSNIFLLQQIEYIEKTMSDGVAQQAAYMLKLWVEGEGDESNKESLLYTLEGLKMQDAAQGVFT